MDFLLWVVLGGLAGWIASMIMGTAGSLLWDIVMGIIGAILGGVVMNLLGQSGVTGFNLYSLIVAVVGACIVIYIGRLLRRTT